MRCCNVRVNAPYPYSPRKSEQVLRSVTLRESRLTEVKQALQAFQWHRGRDTDAVGLVAALAGLRGASLGVVRAVVVSGLAFCCRYHTAAAIVSPCCPAGHTSESRQPATDGASKERALFIANTSLNRKVSKNWSSY